MTVGGSLQNPVLSPTTAADNYSREGQEEEQAEIYFLCVKSTEELEDDEDDLEDEDEKEVEEVEEDVDECY